MMKKFVIAFVAAAAAVVGGVAAEPALAKKAPKPFLSFVAPKRSFRSGVSGTGVSPAYCAYTDVTSVANFVASYAKYKLNRSNPLASTLTTRLVTITGQIPGLTDPNATFPITANGLSFVLGGGTARGGMSTDTIAYVGTVDVKITSVKGGRVIGTFTGTATSEDDTGLDDPLNITIKNGKINCLLQTGG